MAFTPSMGFSEAPFIMKAAVAKGTDAHSRVSQDGYEGSTYFASGPFVLKKWVPGYRFEYEKHEGWVGSVPEGESVWVDGVNVVEVPDKTTLLAGNQEEIFNKTKQKEEIKIEKSNFKDLKIRVIVDDKSPEGQHRSKNTKGIGSLKNDPRRVGKKEGKKLT